MVTGYGFLGCGLGMTVLGGTIRRSRCNNRLGKNASGAMDALITRALGLLLPVFVAMDPIGEMP